MGGRHLRMLGLWILTVICFSVSTENVNSQSTGTISPSNTFTGNFDVMYGQEANNVQTMLNDRVVALSLTQESGSGIMSKDRYLFGYLSMKLKLVPNSAAGVVVAYYTHSETQMHDEFDFEFLGNKTGEPWILQTNIYKNGKGGREQRVNLWFNPAAKYHRYSIVWSHQILVFLVDTVPVRFMRNTPLTSTAFPNQQPMRVFSSIWNGDQWATRGGLDKIDWSYSPFTAMYKQFHQNGCAYPVTAGFPDCTAASYNAAWWSTYSTLTPVERRKYERVTEKFMVYNYCTDTVRYAPGQMPECSESLW